MDTATPAEIGPADGLQHARGPIPRQVDFELGVRVEGEEFSTPIDGERVGVTQAAGDELPRAAIEVGAANPTAAEATLGFTAEDGGQGWQERVVAPELRHAGAREGGEGGSVAREDVE